MEWPWNFAVDDESILIIDKFHYFIRAVLEKKSSTAGIYFEIYAICRGK